MYWFFLKKRVSTKDRQQFKAGNGRAVHPADKWYGIWALESIRSHGNISSNLSLNRLQKSSIPKLILN